MPFKKAGKSNNPLDQFISYSNFYVAHRAFCLIFSPQMSLKSFLQAEKYSHWREAVCAEISALVNSNTWTLTSLPPNKKPIRCKCFYKIKYKSDGTIERYKARLVEKGYNQVQGLDYHDTFASVAKLVTVRAPLSFTAIKKWFLYQLDVNNAFLQGGLGE